MRRLLLAATLAGAATFATPQATADTHGCDAPADVVCNMTPCQPDMPCSIWICLVYVAPDCIL